MIKNKKISHLEFTCIIAFVFIMLFILPLSAEKKESTFEPLTIMLTNDDGYNAPGLMTLRDVLKAAGHNVTVVAPLQNQSGMGGAISTSLTINVQEKSPGVWAVNSTPVVAMRVGIDVIMAGKRPDIIISGMNFGQNLGERASLSSGTLGAAVSSIYNGIPAIAVNVGFIVNEYKNKPPFPSTYAALPLAANFMVRLLEQLQQNSKDGKLLPDHVMLNINFPVPYDQIKGVALTSLGRYSFSGLKYSDPNDVISKGGGDVVVIGDSPVGPDPVEDAEYNLYLQNYITITIMDGDMTAKTPTYNSLKHFFFDLQPY